MKILHYIFGMPPVRGGGLIQYGLDLAEEQKKMGEKTFILCPGSIFKRNSSKVKIKIDNKYNGVPVYKIQNPLPIPLANGIRDIEWYTNEAGYTEYRDFLTGLKPDIIHVHSLMGLHVSFLRAANDLKIKVVFTTHDYFGLCPRTVMIRDNANCDAQDWANCETCCSHAFGTMHLMLDQSSCYCKFMNWSMAKKVLAVLMRTKEYILKINLGNNSVAETKGLEVQGGDRDSGKYKALKDYYKELFQRMDVFHYNSLLTKEVYENYITPKNHYVIPLLNKDCSDNRKIRNYSKKIRIGFLGNESYHKGFWLLKEVTDQLYNEKKQFIVNRYFQPISNEKQQEYLKINEPYKHADLDRIFEQNDVIVVPSICKETFGMVVAEAFSYGVPVIVSENVGAAMMLEEHPGTGQIIRGDLKQGLYQSLKEIIDDPSRLEFWNREICRADMDFSFKNHVKQIIEKCYERDIDEDK